MIYEDLNPKDFFAKIPTGIVENIKFRESFHKLAKQSKELQKWFLDCCREYAPIAFNALFCTLNPQKPPGERMRPFILRPKQIGAVEVLDWCIKNGHDCGINKARKEGATELVSKMYALHCILYKKSNFIVGSRKKELVDKFGDDYTIFAKIDNAFQYLPSWLGFDYLGESNDRIYRKDMLIRVNETGSAITGETTNENFSAGGRATSMLLDEFGRIEKYIADSIEGTIHDVTDCVIYNSTHWLGIGHTFNQVLAKPTTRVIVLDWHTNPEKSVGLYESPKPGAVILVDEYYYEQNYPGLLKYAN